MQRNEDYASNLDYKQERKNNYQLKKTQLADLEIERKILNLAQKGMHSVIGITDSSISKVTKRTLSVLDGKQ
jgi:predicted XRE-type DNA-binding protein